MRHVKSPALSLPCFAVLGMALLAAPGTAFSQAGHEEEIVAAIKAKSAAQIEQIKKMTYRADTKTTIRNAQDKVERVIESYRMITYAPPDNVQNDFMGMTINGRALTRMEMEAELKKSRGKSRKSPFHPGQTAKYHFTLAGGETYEGQHVWKVNFEPVEKTEELARGYAYALQNTLDVVYLSFTPSKLPGVMQKMEAQIVYQPADGFWVPQTFSMDMHVKVAFIFTLADQFIHIQEKYSEYDFKTSAGPGPDDSQGPDGQLRDVVRAGRKPGIGY